MIEPEQLKKPRAHKIGIAAFLAPVLWLFFSPARSQTPTAESDSVETWLDHFFDGLAQALLALQHLGAIPEKLAEISRQSAQSSVLLAIVKLGLVSAAYVVAEKLYRRVSFPLHARILAVASPSPGERLLLAGGRLLVDGIGIAAITFAVMALNFALFGRDSLLGRTVASIIIFALVARLAAVLMRAIFSADHAPLRLLPLSDPTASVAQSWTSAAVVVILVAQFIVRRALDRLGLPEATAIGASLVLGVVAFGLLVVAIIRTRATTSLARRQPQGSVAPSGWLARSWHVVAFVYLLVALSVFLVQIAFHDSIKPGKIILSLVMVAAIPVVMQAIRSVLHLSTVESLRNDTFVRFCVTGIGIALFLLAFTPLLEAVAFSVIGDTGPDIGRIVVRAAFTILVTLIIVAALWSWINRWFERNISGPKGQGDAIVGTRLQTLAPIVRIAVLIAIIIIGGLIILSSLGVDIGPLLAGAGVLGVALAWGSQQLVRDVISGIFFMLDDAFRVGEYVEVERIKGTVEKITLRSLVLRHHRGAVHVLPFGQIRALTNQSRDWVIDKVEFELVYGTDAEKVRKLVKKIGQEIADDPRFSADMLEPPKGQGMARFAASGVIFQAKFKSLPGKQFAIRRELLRRMHEVFAQNAIEFAYPTVTISGGGDGAVTAAAGGLITHRDNSKS